MAFIEIFRRKRSTASVAKDRLQIIVARERSAMSSNSLPELAKLQQELLAVIAKYERLDLDQVTVSVDKRDDGEVLELNVMLPEPEPSKPAARRSRLAYA